MNRINAIIIGSGIAGLTAAIYLKRANTSFIVLEGQTPGGKMTTLGEVENYPGFVKTSGLSIYQQLDAQLKSLEIKVEYGQVQNVIKDEEGFLVTTDVETYRCDAVLVATGTIVKQSGILGEKEFASRGVSYCATCDGNFYRGLPVAVIGNSEPAVEETLYLANIASKVHYFVDSAAIIAPDNLVERLTNQNNVEIHKRAKVLSIDGDENGVSSLTFEDEDNQRNIISVRGVFPLVGFKTSNQFLKELSPENKNGYIIVDKDMMSSVPGLFAAGDVIDKNVRQLVTAAGDGASASNSIVRYVRNVKKQ